MTETSEDNMIEHKLSCEIRNGHRCDCDPNGYKDVHVYDLEAKITLCGMKGPPINWGVGQEWVRAENAHVGASCFTCRMAFFDAAEADVKRRNEIMDQLTQEAQNLGLYDGITTHDLPRGALSHVNRHGYMLLMRDDYEAPWRQVRVHGEDLILEETPEKPMQLARRMDEILGGKPGSEVLLVEIRPVFQHFVGKKFKESKDGP